VYSSHILHRRSRLITVDNCVAGRVAVEGKVEHKFDMKPTNMGNNDEAYRKLCRDRLNKSMLKTRTTQVLQNDRGGYMRPMPMEAWPVSASKV
jgi:transcription initiation factor TFIIF subunit beta